MIAKLFVPAGAPSQPSCGLISAPSQLNALGIVASAVKLCVESLKLCPLAEDEANDELSATLDELAAMLELDELITLEMLLDDLELTMGVSDGVFLSPDEPPQADRNMTDKKKVV